MHSRFEIIKTLCIGCNHCASICQYDILLSNEIKVKTPAIMYPGECCYCGISVMVCPVKEDIKLEYPLMKRAKFILAVNA